MFRPYCVAERMWVSRFERLITRRLRVSVSRSGCIISLVNGVGQTNRFLWGKNEEERTLESTRKTKRQSQYRSVLINSDQGADERKEPCETLFGLELNHSEIEATNTTSDGAARAS